MVWAIGETPRACRTDLNCFDINHGTCQQQEGRARGVLDAAGVGNAAAVVVRYYGGRKLGAGALARAYGAAARAALAGRWARVVHPGEESRHPPGQTRVHTTHLTDLTALASLEPLNLAALAFDGCL